MLNQVPRTLLNIGMDPSLSVAESDDGSPPPFDWNSLTLAAETKAGEAPAGGSASVTPHANSGRVNGGGSSGRGAEFFGAAGAGHEEGAPPMRRSGRGRGARAGETGSKGEGAPPMMPASGRPRSAFTNESIADQALKDFGDGAVSIFSTAFPIQRRSELPMGTPAARTMKQYNQACRS